MRRIPLTIAVALIATVLTPFGAFAGWRYAEWGATPEEVVENSEGKAELLAEPKETAKGLIIAVKSRTLLSDIPCDVVFQFTPDTRQLVGISLMLRKSNQGGDLYVFLEDQYGQPNPDDVTVKLLEDGESHIVHWRDPELGNQVTYFGVGDLFGVDFAPLDGTVPDR